MFCHMKKTSMLWKAQKKSPHCSSVAAKRKEIIGDDIDFLAELLQAGLQSLPPNCVVGDSKDWHSVLISLFDVILEHLKYNNVNFRL